MSKAHLYTEGLTLGYESNLIVNDLNLKIPTGKITALVGANGSGKSTILKSMARILQPKVGSVFLDGKAIHKQSTKKVAQQLAILPQNPEAPSGLTVRELISFGRTPYQQGFGNLNKKDLEMIDWALTVTNLHAFTNRSVDSLSGGQRQRAWIAMALAQGTDILLLDEPTTFLDMAHQLEVLKLLKKLNEEEQRTIIMVVHDLNHASGFADNMVAIKTGTVVKEGSPKCVMTTEVLEEVFGIRADIIPDPRSNLPLCIPYGLSNENSKDCKNTTSRTRVVNI